MDKIYHFTACFIFTIALSFFFNHSIGIAFTLGLAIGKEVGDYMNYGRNMKLGEFLKLSIPDLIADGAGIVIGIIL